MYFHSSYKKKIILCSKLCRSKRRRQPPHSPAHHHHVQRNRVVQHVTYVFILMHVFKSFILSCSLTHMFIHMYTTVSPRRIHSTVERHHHTAPPRVARRRRAQSTASRPIHRRRHAENPFDHAAASLVASLRHRAKARQTRLATRHQHLHASQHADDTRASCRCQGNASRCQGNTSRCQGTCCRRQTS